MRAEVERLQHRLEDAKEKLTEAQNRVREATDRAERAERANMASSQQMAGQNGDLHNMSQVKVRYEAGDKCFIVVLGRFCEKEKF